MGYETTQALNSEKAYRILRELHLKREEGGSYPRAISKELGAHPNTISDIFKALRELNIVIRGKRTRAQYYEIDLEGLIGLCVSLLDKLTEDANDILAEHDYNDLEKPEEYPDKHLQKFEKFLKHYINNYLRFNEEGTIKSMVVEDLIHGLEEIDYREKQEEVDLGVYFNPLDLKEEEWFEKFLSNQGVAYNTVQNPNHKTVVQAAISYLQDRDL